MPGTMVGTTDDEKSILKMSYCFCLLVKKHNDALCYLFFFRNSISELQLLKLCLL